MTQTGPREQRIQVASITLVAAIWLGTTYAFWVGYAGADDMFYARYAYLFHRPPINWWEFRIPAVLAIRASFLTLGPSEFAAALPTLVASLAILTSVAWFVGWPAKVNWQAQGAVILAATLPVDVGYRSVPSATFLAAGFLALGTVCVLKGTGWRQWLGAALLAVAFATHELSFFYVAIFCFTALVTDRKRFLRPVLACVIISAAIVLIEGMAYNRLLGDPLARFKVSASTTSNLPIAYDPDTGVSGLRFFTWPLENLVYCKAFGFGLGALLCIGIATWKKFTTEQRVLFVTTFAVWAWLGFGTQVPWAYRPLYRQQHYYAPLAVGVAALLPVGLQYVWGARLQVAQAALALLIAAQLISSAAGGRWGADVDVSRQLLRYAQGHGDQTFLTDVATLNQMYVLGGFRLPPNVVCANGPAVTNNLLVNKEPAGTPRFRFPAPRIDGILLNADRRESGGLEHEFLAYVNEYHGADSTIAPLRYKPLFAPLVRLIGQKGFTIRSFGGAVARLR